jgi:hypothetical protein
MVRIISRKPSYALKDVKALIRADNILFGRNAIRYAQADFGWNASDLKKCLLKLNDRYYPDNPQKNHFYKTTEHSFFPNTMMDYYKAQEIIKGINVYTHFYINPDDGNLVVNSFKEI